MLGSCADFSNSISKNMSFRNTSRFSNSMVPDSSQQFSLNLASAVDKVYQRNILSRQIFDAFLSLIYILDSLFLVNSLICVNCRLTYYSHLLITFANNLDPDQAHWE